MQFERLYSLVCELSQNTVLQARHQHNQVKNNNPVAAIRHKAFDDKSHKYMQNKNSYIRAKSLRDTNKLSHYYGIYLKQAFVYTKDETADTIKISGTMTERESGISDHEGKNIELEYNLAENKLRNNVDGEIKPELFLQSRTDAEVLAKFIRAQTGKIISWKQMNFIDQADYINQHKDKYAI